MNGAGDPAESVAYDPVAANTLADPFPAYAELREHCPVHRFKGLERPMYTFSRRSDVVSVLTDPSLWSNRLGPGISISDSAVGDLQRYDPPEHESRRRFLRAPFLPRAVEALAPGVEARARALISDLRAQGAAELHDQYALPLPVQGFVDMMGLDSADVADVKRWADDLTVGMTFPDQARSARKEMTAYTLEQIRRRRSAVQAADLEPGVDPVGRVVREGLLSHMACHRLEDGTQLPEGEVAGMVGQLLVAGHETTTSLITNAVWRLLEVPERWDRLASRPSLVPNVIEESLRFDPPVLGICKTNNSPLERHGVSIEPTSKVMILYASANREQSDFERPDDFDMERPLLESKRHLSFGWGEHFCLGSHLARLTARHALAVLIDELPSLRLTDEPERVGAPFLWGRSKLLVAWDASAA